MTDKFKVYEADLSDFQPEPKNHNKHTQRGHKMVTNSMQKRGYARPAFAANDGTVLGGNLSTMEVAPAVGLGDGKVIVVETQGDVPIIHKRRDVEPGSTEARALSYEDNLTAWASLDLDQEIVLADIDAGFSFDDIGVTLPDLSALGVDVGGNGKEPGSPSPTVTEAEKYQERWQVKSGDVWQLGKHKIACLDSLNADNIKRVVDGLPVSFVFADPPYGINIVAANGYVGGGEAYDIPFGGVKGRKGYVGGAHGTKTKQENTRSKSGVKKNEPLPPTVAADAISRLVAKPTEPPTVALVGTTL